MLFKGNRNEIQFFSCSRKFLFIPVGYGSGGGGGSGEVFERFLILKVCVLWSEHLGPPKIIC